MHTQAQAPVPHMCITHTHMCTHRHRHLTHICSQHMHTCIHRHLPHLCAQHIHSCAHRSTFIHTYVHHTDMCINKHRTCTCSTYAHNTHTHMHMYPLVHTHRGTQAALMHICTYNRPACGIKCKLHRCAILQLPLQAFSSLAPSPYCGRKECG